MNKQEQWVSTLGNMRNQEVTKGTFRTVEEFMDWYDLEYDSYGKYLKACADYTNNRKLAHLMALSIISPLANVITVMGDQHLLVHDGYIYENSMGSKVDGDERIINITDLIYSELDYHGEKEQFLKLIKERQYKKAGDVLSVTLWGFKGTFTYKRIQTSDDISINHIYSVN